ncbi:hypothetical protein [Polymorphospora rubra]|uniref:hypothetical protein n=1 Tax=Polymorphospora rubra TaxID=338584 RepID=UPI003CCEDCFB
MKLFVNGPPDFGGSTAQAAYTGAWSATGDFAIGRAWNGTPTQGWTGDLDHVYAAQSVWTDWDILLHAAM